MIDSELLEILCCPETKQNVKLIEEDIIFHINEKITTGKVTNRGGQIVEEKVEGQSFRFWSQQTRYREGC